MADKKPKQEGGRIEQALRAIADEGNNCSDCGSELCPKHNRIDKHIRFVKARHTWLDEPTAEHEQTKEEAADAYDEAVRRERVWELARVVS